MRLSPEVERDLRVSFYNILNCVAPTAYVARFASTFAGGQEVKLPWFDNYLPVRGCTLRMCAFEAADTSSQQSFVFAFVLEADGNLTERQYAVWVALDYGIQISTCSRILLPDVTGIQLDPANKQFMKRMCIPPVLKSYPEREELLQKYEQEKARASTGVTKLNLGKGNGGGLSTEDLIVKCMTYKGSNADALRIAATMVCQLKLRQEIEAVCSLKLESNAPLLMLYNRLQQACKGGEV